MPTDLHGIIEGIHRRPWRGGREMKTKLDKILRWLAVARELLTAPGRTSGMVDLAGQALNKAERIAAELFREVESQP
jgi:hypothetical protein